MTAKKNTYLIGGVVVFGIIGFLAGLYLAKQMMESKKEYVLLDKNQTLVEYPSHLAKKSKFPIDRKNKLLVIDKCDYKEITKKGPIIAKLKDDVKIEENGNQYRVNQNNCFRVESNNDKSVVIIGKTNKGNEVKLTLKRSDVENADDGIWVKVVDSNKNEGWVYNIEKPKSEKTNPEEKKPVQPKPVEKTSAEESKVVEKTVENQARKNIATKYINDNHINSAKVSSTHDQIGTHNFNAGNSWGYYETPRKNCWAPASSGVGETFTLVFDDLYLVDNIYMWVGAPCELGSDSDRIRKSFGLPTKVRIYADDEEIGEFRFSDNDYKKELKFDKTYDAKSITIEILEVRPGTEHNFPCIASVGWGKFSR